MKIPDAGSVVIVRQKASGDHDKTGGKEFSIKGRIMPSTTDRTLVLKLDSGYNVGIDISKITDIEIEEQAHEHAAPKAHAAKNRAAATTNPNIPIISILHTGGTIASKVDYETGGVIARYTPEEIMDMFPELQGIGQIRSRLVRNMWSEDIRLDHYNIMAQEIEKEIASGAQGIIVTHGTDTLHYTGAALSFMLDNLPVPVILVGSQRSSDRASSDAAINLLSAASFIAKHPDFREVGICMHESTNDDTCVILPGNKSRKMHSSRRDAFKAINTTAIARINLAEKTVIVIDGTHFSVQKQGLKVTLMDANIKIGFLKVHPHMRAEEVSFYKEHRYDGLIIEGTGISGNMPINETDNETKEHTKIAEAVRALVESGTVVASTTQTIYGGINMNVYSTGRKMQELGIIGNYTDMTPETGFIKLAWLLSNNPHSTQEQRKKIKELYEKDLRGEISERIDPTLG